MPAIPPSAASRPSRATRVVVSALVALHVAAVFVGPWAMQGSELSGVVAGAMRPYLEFMRLSNGYRFFAPEPGPSHLVRYEVTLPDGQKVAGEFPNRETEWPRLRYHRYFMLSETMNTLQTPGVARATAEAVAQSYAEQLLAENHGRSVSLYLRRHYVPRMQEVREGRHLNDKALYEERPLVSFEPDEP